MELISEVFIIVYKMRFHEVSLEKNKHEYFRDRFLLFFMEIERNGNFF